MAQRRAAGNARMLCVAGAIWATAACASAIRPLAEPPAPTDEEAHTGTDTAASDTAASDSAAPAPAVAPPARVVTASMMRRALDSMLRQPQFRTATWGILIVDEAGDTLYARNAATLMIPASNMKIVTAVTALAQLGPDFRFRDTALALTARDTMPDDFGPMYDTLFLRDHPLRDVLPKMLKPSQNQLAEQLARTVALEATGSASRDSAIAVTARQLAEWHVPDDGYILADGSGYDRGNYLSPETLVELLSHVRRDSAFSVFYDALPIAGVDGTLVRRMRASSAASNAHAKTGSLHSIRALSGYVTTADGVELTFSFICNAYTVPPDAVLGTMDSTVVLLSELSGKR